MSTRIDFDDAEFEAATTEDVHWQRRAEQAADDALPALRAAADRWAAVVGGLLAAGSIGALLKGPGQLEQLHSPWAAVAKLAFLAAVIAGVYAVVAAQWAAQLSIGRLSIASALRLQEFYGDRLDDAAKHYSRSRGSALAAVILLVIAGGAVWLGPTDPTSVWRVRLSTGALMCGAPQARAASLELQDGSNRYAARWADVVRVQRRDRCP